MKKLVIIIGVMVLIGGGLFIGCASKGITIIFTASPGTKSCLISQNSSGKVTVTITEYDKDCNQTSKTYTADSLDEFKKKYPEIAKEYGIGENPPSSKEIPPTITGIPDNKKLIDAQEELIQIHEGNHYTWYCDRGFYETNKEKLSQYYDVMDKFYDQIVKDLGFDPELNLSLKLMKPFGGAYAGGNEVGLGYDAFTNVEEEVEGYWGYVLPLHETINHFTGFISGGWPVDWWADHKSPFPLTTAVMVLQELGYENIAKIHLKKHLEDPLVKMFLDFHKKYGWKMFQKMFQELKEDKIKWFRIGENPSEILSHYVAFYLNLGADKDLSKELNDAGVGILPEQIKEPHCVDLAGSTGFKTEKNIRYQLKISVNNTNVRITRSDGNKADYHLPEPATEGYAGFLVMAPDKQRWIIDNVKISTSTNRGLHPDVMSGRTADRTVFQEDFSVPARLAENVCSARDGIVNSKWEIGGGQWFLKSQQLMCQTNNRMQYIIIKDVKLKNFECEFDVEWEIGRDSWPELAFFFASQEPTPKNGGYLIQVGGRILETKPGQEGYSIQSEILKRIGETRQMIYTLQEEIEKNPNAGPPEADLPKAQGSKKKTATDNRNNLSQAWNYYRTGKYEDAIKLLSNK